PCCAGARALRSCPTRRSSDLPRVVVARMLLNIGVDTLVGMIPVAGDVFDLLWRSNTRNLALLERHQGELEPGARASDYLWVGGADRKSTRLNSSHVKISYAVF